MIKAVCKFCGLPSVKPLCEKCGETVGLLLLDKVNADTEKRYNEALDVIGETARMFGRSQDEKKALHCAICNLLAVIHKDGGHYTFKNGVEKSTSEAEKIVVQLMEDNEQLRKRFEWPIEAERVLSKMNDEDCENALSVWRCAMSGGDGQCPNLNSLTRLQTFGLISNIERFEATDESPELFKFDLVDLLDAVVIEIRGRKEREAHLREISNTREDISRLKALIKGQ